MTEQTQPTDAELLAEYDRVFNATRTIDRHGVALRAVLAKWGTPAGAGCDHPYAIQWDAELGRTAMRFVDRAGDVHPGIDDAETICADFHAAMSAVIERMPHVQRMSPTPQPTQAQAGAPRVSPEQWQALFDDQKRLVELANSRADIAESMLKAVQAQTGAVPLPSVDLMRLVMDVEQRHNFLRGTTNWAVAVGRAIEAAHGIKGSDHA